MSVLVLSRCAHAQLTKFSSKHVLAKLPMKINFPTSRGTYAAPETLLLTRVFSEVHSMVGAVFVVWDNIGKYE